MPVRFRRRRVLIISVVSIFVIIYLISNRSKDSIDNRDDLPDQEIKKDDRRLVNPVISEETTTTTKKSWRALPDKFVEIDGKQLRKIDWHDYEAIERENARKGKFYKSRIDVLIVILFSLGVGEGGIGVEPSAQERNSGEFQRLYRENGFNAFISNNISLNRSVKDIRHPE